MNLLLVLAIVLVVPPFYWYFLDTSPGDARPKPITIADLRRLAAEPQGEAPSAIRYAIVGIDHRFGNTVAAGTGLRTVALPSYVFAIERADAPPIYVDARRPDPLSGDDDLALPDARGLGFATATNAGLLASRAIGSPQASEAPGRTDDTSPRALARGVVLIPVTGLGDIHNMLFIRTEADREYLLTGRVAQVRANWAQGHVQSRYLTTFEEPADRGELTAWLATIRKLRREAPGLEVVEGHAASLPRGLARNGEPSEAAVR
ncbi:hypothetical protein B2G71_16725 [Novosphingobium sp. PC22D]|uniref:hypothetical protein n=1 Tax=Novosphingobium sp. PC22D TaxID=1962403 RepID=UPI000BF000AC|nr:hypothetical protein [Novosphingobium sp. PC22D]PEQ11476.1 hypothetical protein B2G71_16725 [Novosphingobium sp. PC22D]